jgi:hypothetical protein
VIGPSVGDVETGDPYDAERRLDGALLVHVLGRARPAVIRRHVLAVMTVGSPDVRETRTGSSHWGQAYWCWRATTSEVLSAGPAPARDLTAALVARHDTWSGGSRRPPVLHVRRRQGVGRRVVPAGDAVRHADDAGRHGDRDRRVLVPSRRETGSEAGRGVKVSLDVRFVSP